MLAYGIATAAVLRLVMIAAGAQLIERFQPTLLVFAAVLLFSAYKIVARSGDEEEEDLASNSIVQLCRCARGAASPRTQTSHRRWPGHQADALHALWRKADGASLVKLARHRWPCLLSWAAHEDVGLMPAGASSPSATSMRATVSLRMRTACARPRRCCWCWP